METIAAIATPPGHGAIAIVRCSGPDARAIAARVFRAQGSLEDRVARYGTIVDARGQVIDRGLGLAMNAPRTVTGEDVVELHIHGSPVGVRDTLRALLDAGARAAGPGEFTRRAFLNGKIDLSAAEAVADAIAAESTAAARAAQANLAGALRREIEAIRSELDALLEELSGSIDYPDEIPEPEPGRVRGALAGVRARLERLSADWERGRAVREGLALAIVGPPNVGKSSILNALLGEERAIVSPYPGTTRDPIEDRFAVDGVYVRAVDTAGQRVTEDPVERIGVDRAAAMQAAATVLLVVVDGSAELSGDAARVVAGTRERRRVVLFNMRDRGTRGFDAREPDECDALSGSSFDPATIDEVRRRIAEVGWGGELPDAARPHLASARHAGAVARAREALDAAAATVAGGAETDYVVPELVAASAALGEITGAAVTEAILDGVFARFCVGK